MKVELTFTEKTISNLMTIAAAGDPLALMVTREERQDIGRQLAEQLSKGNGKDESKTD